METFKYHYTKKDALKERVKLLKRLETEKDEHIRFDIERRIGDLNQFYINREEKSEYDKQAEQFLKETGTEFKAEFLENGLYFPDDKEPRDIYFITLKRGSREYKFKFGQSITQSGKWIIYNSKGRITTNDKKEMFKHRANHEDIKINKDFSEPTVYDVLASLTKYNPDGFNNFCSNYGYDEDSRKAEKIYQAVLKEWDEIQKLYSDEEINKLQEIN